MRDFVIENGVLKKYTGAGGDIIIPEGVTAIGGGAFCLYEHIRSISVPDGVKALENYCFSKLSIGNLILPESIEEIGEKAFNLSNISEISGAKNFFAKQDKAWFMTRTGPIISMYFNGTIDKNSAAFNYFADAVKRKKSAVFQNVLLNNDLTQLGKLFALWKNVPLKDLDEYINTSTKSNNASVTTYLLQYKQEAYPTDVLDKKAEDKLDKEFGFKEKTADDWREIFKFSVFKGEVTISGYKGKDKDVVVPEYIGTNKVTKIGKKAFLGSSIKTILLPDSITEIGEKAFCDCDKLLQFKLPASLKVLGKDVFGGCEKFTEFTIPAGLTVIPEGMFYYTGIRNLAIPEGITEIGASAFTECHKLEEIHLPESLEKICEHAFDDCPKLKEIWIPDNVELIEGYAFQNCVKLKDVHLPGNVYFDVTPFWECHNKITFYAPEGSCAEERAKYDNIPFVPEERKNAPKKPSVKPIIPEVKKDFSSLSVTEWREMFKVVVSNGTATLGKYKGKDKIIELPENIGKNKLIAIEERTFHKCDKIKEVVFCGNNISSIPEKAFMGCSSLEKIVFPECSSQFNGNESFKIGGQAFKDCTSLKEITLPSGDVYIGKDAFKGCSSLKTIRILENFRYFTLNDSFTGCKSLADIYLPERLRHIDNVIPKEFKNIVFHVPAGSKTEKLMKENNIPFVAE